MKLTREQRIERAQKALDEGRIIQHSWREGRNLVCALAAFGPGINGDKSQSKGHGCPADVMPNWLAALVPEFDDGIEAADVPCFMQGLLCRARRWDALDAQAWEAIRLRFIDSMMIPEFTKADVRGGISITVAYHNHISGLAGKETVSTATRDLIKTLFHIIDEYLPEISEPNEATDDSISLQTTTA